MAARLWTALLMLAAVFAMHGLQCTSAAAQSVGVAPAHIATAAPTSTDGHSAGATAPGPADLMAADQAVTGPPAAASADPGHGSTPHGSAEHLRTLCLAVLAAGIAVLLAMTGARLIQLASPALRRARTRVSGWLPPPRPPDLFALCLLRT
jgi:hypothetical protein